MLLGSGTLELFGSYYALSGLFICFIIIIIIIIIITSQLFRQTFFSWDLSHRIFIRPALVNGTTRSVAEYSMKSDAPGTCLSGEPLIFSIDQLVLVKLEQAGTGPSRRHIQGSKIAKGLPSVTLQYSKIENPKKMDWVARRGPLARAPGALKGGHFRNCQHFCRSWRGDPLEKNFFWKKSQWQKTERGDPLGFFNIHSVAKHQKIEGENFYFRKKSLAVPKKWKGGPFGLARYGMLRGKTRKTFLVQFAWPNGAIWCNNIL